MEPITWKTYIECSCYSKAHLVCLEYDEEIGLMVSMQLNQWRGFWKRLVEAFKYAFFRPNCGSWDTCMIKPDDIQNIRRWLQNVDMYGPGSDWTGDVTMTKR